MKKIVMFDTSYGTSNMGDFIINEAVNEELKPILEGAFLTRYPTHTPLAHIYQNRSTTLVRKTCDTADLKFLAGTNLIRTNLMVYTPGWNINLFTRNLYENSIAIGCGLDGKVDDLNWYTRAIYDKALSGKFTHSVRDARTQKFFESLGLKALNTGCPTTWILNAAHCSEIPRGKAGSVVFTLTDYERNREDDQRLVDILVDNYKKVYFWIQGSDDYDYYKELSNTDSVVIIPPSLESYRSILISEDIDYVGTRLHAGIFAMRHKRRSIILIVDDRARDMQKTHNINALERKHIDRLKDLINSDFSTRVNINEDRILAWKSQFTSD